MKGYDLENGSCGQRFLAWTIEKVHHLTLSYLTVVRTSRTIFKNLLVWTHHGKMLSALRQAQRRCKFCIHGGWKTYAHSSFINHRHFSALTRAVFNRVSIFTFTSSPFAVATSIAFLCLLLLSINFQSTLSSSNKCLTRFQSDRAHFEPCLKTTSFLFLQQPPWIRLDPIMTLKSSMRHFFLVRTDEIFSHTSLGYRSIFIRYVSYPLARIPSDLLGPSCNRRLTLRRYVYGVEVNARAMA